MSPFTRAVAQDFRLLFARCVAGRPRGPAPPVVVQTRGEVRTLAATTADGITLTHTVPAPKEADEIVVLPAAVIAEVEGGTDEVVVLDRPSKLRGVVKWRGGGKPRTLPVELLLPGRQHELPALPSLSPAPAKLLAALHECGRTAAKESGRYALSKVQFQGRHGRVVGTDGRVALLWSGFTFPFADGVLVPALAVFGAKPLARQSDVRLGRTPTHVVVAAGPWAVWLPADTTAKYPDVAGVIPRPAPTVITIAEPDAAAVLPVLPGLPGAEHEQRPVTLDAAGAVRVLAGPAGAVRSVPLASSTAAGPAARAALDRRVLARALVLGCRTWKLAPDKAVVAEGGDVTLVAAPLDPVLVVPPAAGATTESSTTLERRSPMKPPETNGPAPPRGDPADPLDLAEELRAALADAASVATRLVASLRQGKKEKKVLSALMTNLKQLNLGGTS